MYREKGRLKSNRELIAEGHSISEILRCIKTFQRGRKRGEHTHNDPIEILHIKRNKLFGWKGAKEVLLKTV